MVNIKKYKYRCKHCSDTLIPEGQGIIQRCSCGNVAIDSKYDVSGEGYCRVLGDPEDYEEIKVLTKEEKEKLEKFVKSKEDMIKYISKLH